MIMASAEQQAIALKDAYVKGIADATAGSFSALPEQDMGDTATIITDATTGTTTYVNDNRPNDVDVDSARGLQVVHHDDKAANPITGLEGMFKKYEQVPAYERARESATRLVNDGIRHGGVERLSPYHRELIEKGIR